MRNLKAVKIKLVKNIVIILDQYSWIYGFYSEKNSFFYNPNAGLFYKAISDKETGQELILKVSKNEYELIS